MENVNLGARNNPFKFSSTPNLVLHLLGHVLSPKNQFFAYIPINISPRGKLQDIPNIPHKISYTIVSLKVSLKAGTDYESCSAAQPPRQPQT